jgi:hypothetical protein
MFYFADQNLNEPATFRDGNATRPFGRGGS